MSPSSLEDDPTGLPHEQPPTVLRWPGPEQLSAPFEGAIRSGPILRELSEADLESPGRRRVFLPAFLFLAACFSTFFAGALNWNPEFYISANQVDRALAENWRQGLVYMASVIGILLTHGLGHFWQTVRYRVPASWAFFIPVPVLMTGTMRAVSGMERSRATRKALL